MKSTNDMGTVKIESFDTVDLSTAQNIIAAQTDDAKSSTWKLFNDDYWQEGELWTGPRVQSGMASGTVMAEIERGLVSNNVLREVTLRHCNAVTIRQPTWGSVPRRALQEDETPTVDEARRIGELDALLTAWWDSPLRGTYTDAKGRLCTGNVHKLLRRAARLFAVTGRANLRVFIPPGLRDEKGLLQLVPFAEAAQRIYVELCEPDVAALYVHRAKMQQIGVYLWKDGNTDMAELTYLDDTGKTVLRQVAKADPRGEQVDAGTAGRAFDLGGQLMHFEMIDDPFVLPSLVSQQKSITKTLTMGDRNENLAGFPERVLKDVQLDGKWVDDPEAPNGKRFVPYPMEMGAATVNVFQGAEYEDEEGKVKRASPSYERMEPLGSSVFDTAFDKKRERMLHQSGQTHVLISGDATASGVSREHARDEFKLSIAETEAELNRAGAWLLNLVIALAGATARGENPYADLRVEFSCQIHLGPLSAAERAEDRAQVEAGLLSSQRAMERAGVADSDAENARIAAERDQSLGMMQDRATVLETLTRAGAGIGPAARVAGFSDEQVVELERSDFVDGDENNPLGNNPQEDPNTPPENDDA
jgi:hypothetical protein